MSGYDSDAQGSGCLVLIWSNFEIAAGDKAESTTLEETPKNQTVRRPCTVGYCLFHRLTQCVPACHSRCPPQAAFLLMDLPVVPAFFLLAQLRAPLPWIVRRGLDGAVSRGTSLSLWPLCLPVGCVRLRFSSVPLFSQHSEEKRTKNMQSTPRARVGRMCLCTQ